MHTASNPNHPGKDWYEELCALAAIGELSSSEFDELRKHLAECDGCRQIYYDFRRVSGGDLGLVAALRQSERDGEEAGALVDEAAVLDRLLDRATRERANRGSQSTPETPESERQRVRGRFASWMHWLRRPALSYGSLRFNLCAIAALGAYRLREAQVSPTLHGLRNEVAEWKDRVNAIAAQEKSTSQSLQTAEAERERARKALADAEDKYAALQAQERPLEVELANERAQLDQKGQELNAARNTSDAKDKEIAPVRS